MAEKNKNRELSDFIYDIRGQQVMLDSDLADLYGYEVKNFNRQVNNNIRRFPSDFMFQLTKDEYLIILRCKNSTSNTYGGRRYLPYVFTEQGIYMLAAVLKGKQLKNKVFISCVNLKECVIISQKTKFYLAALMYLNYQI